MLAGTLGHWWREPVLLTSSTDTFPKELETEWLSIFS